MNEVCIIVQAKDDPKNLLSTAEKAKNFREGLTVVFMDQATEGGQIGIELIIKGVDIKGNSTIIGFAVTENNWEALMGAFIGARMRFGRMPKDEFEIVRHYIKQKAKAFIQFLPAEKRSDLEPHVKKFFGI
jgi:hypothetical protein